MRRSPCHSILRPLILRSKFIALVSVCTGNNRMHPARPLWCQNLIKNTTDRGTALPSLCALGLAHVGHRYKFYMCCVSYRRTQFVSSVCVLSLRTYTLKPRSSGLGEVSPHFLPVTSIVSSRFPWSCTVMQWELRLQKLVDLFAPVGGSFRPLLARCLVVWAHRPAAWIAPCHLSWRSNS